MHANVFPKPTRSPAPDAERPLAFWLGLCRPLLTVDEARWLLGDPSRRSLVRRLNDGTLPALDIGTPETRGDRREVRIFRAGVEQLLVRPGRPLERPAVETIFPPGRATLHRKEVAVLLNCTPRHVGKLALAEPRLAAGDGTSRIRRAPLVEFLNARALPPHSCHEHDNDHV